MLENHKKLRKKMHKSKQKLEEKKLRLKKKKLERIIRSIKIVKRSRRIRSIKIVKRNRRIRKNLNSNKKLIKKQKEKKQQEKKQNNKVQVINENKSYAREFKALDRKINGQLYRDIRLQIDQSNELDYNSIINANINQIENELNEMQRKNNQPFKMQVEAIVEVIEQLDSKKQYSRYIIKTDFVPINNVNQTLLALISNNNTIQLKIQSLGNSNLQFSRYLFITVRVFQYQQQSVGSYIELEDALKNKKAVMNIQNTNDECAIYAFLYFYYTVERGLNFKDYQRPNNYKYQISDGVLNVDSINKTKISRSFNIGNVKFPTNLEDLQRIAKAFDYTMSVFEYQITKQQTVECRVVHNDRPIAGKNHIDLLIAKKESEDNINYHVMNVKNFNALMNKGNNNHKVYYCKNCLNYFYDQQKLNDHINSCYLKQQASNDKYPSKGTFIKFKNYKNMQLNPIVIFADFEAFVTKIENPEQLTQEEIVENITSNTKTTKLAKHTPASFFIQVYDEYKLLNTHEYEFIKERDDQDVIAEFLKTIDSITTQTKQAYKTVNIPFEETEELRQRRRDAEECYICSEPFTRQDYAVIDHNHFTGEVRGIAHKSCNLHFHLQKNKVPVIFHNLRGYDSHLILKEISKHMKNNDITDIDAIVNNKEKFMSFSYGDAKFIDSFQFMASSLQQLGKNLSIDQKKYTMTYLKDRFGNILKQDEIEQIMNKGLFPYAWFDSSEKLKQKTFPKMKDFYNDLDDKPVDKDEYNQSKELYKKLGFKSFKQWLSLYQILDVKILVDVWLNFRYLCMQNYKLDPSFYYTSPGLAWDAMLLKTNIKLELISDPDMYLMFERQSRGGISTTGNLRYAKSNNQYVEDYKKNEDYTQIIYLDMNNLYGAAMQEKLPTSNFKFIEESEFKNFDLNFILNYDNGNDGYVYEVDLEYPKKLHDKHNNYPLAPEQLSVKYEQLSQYNKDAISKLSQEDIKISMANIKKLTPNLYSKEKYVCNIRNLKLYLEQGLVLKKIHRIISFNQTDFMTSYINLNTSLRQKAKNDFEKDFFKLMNNSVFGKTMENVRNRQNVKLVFTEKKMKKVMNSRYFKSFTPINEDLAIVQMYQKVVKLDKPSYVGYQILDFSKIYMYDFYYNKLLKEFTEIDVIMTDTDSLFMRIKCSEKYNIYDSMIKNNNDYDLSNVTKGNLYNKIVNHCENNNLNLKEFLNKNKSVVGKMKSEVPDMEIIEAVSIKSKCYDFTTINSCSKKIKGIKKSVVKNNITHQDFKDCILKQTVKNITQRTIRSFNHDIYTIEQQKLALQYFNDKRFILEDGINSYAYGHYKAMQQE